MKKVTVFKFKELEAQAKFKTETTETNELSQIIDAKKTIQVVTKIPHTGDTNSLDRCGG